MTPENRKDIDTIVGEAKKDGKIALIRSLLIAVVVLAGVVIYLFVHDDKNSDVADSRCNEKVIELTMKNDTLTNKLLTLEKEHRQEMIAIYKENNTDLKDRIATQERVNANVNATIETNKKVIQQLKKK